MTDQERIKNIIATAKREVRITKTKSANFLPHVLMPVNHVECFIQQAEEKQKLDKHEKNNLKHIKQLGEDLTEKYRAVEELEQQNKRYEEAIDKIAECVLEHLSNGTEINPYKIGDIFDDLEDKQ
ncbi:hypothetical protein Pryu01_03038 [Paraliobacillus ryukyuensis]|uniref:Uncharacterized protein n=1 Tax=Paraliobacillus ryukyuensis TaxID=200904 RepID=A0A366DS22_9BACI|nr:hypothetical protein [Paraliobacillus ryukyuensis]RBO92269.1 hypothetical protein DES48_1157 [Paraliobacillus ryukyuensis]